MAVAMVAITKAGKVAISNLSHALVSYGAFHLLREEYLARKGKQRTRMEQELEIPALLRTHLIMYYTLEPIITNHEFKSV